MRITGKLAGVGGAAAASVLALAILAVPWAGAAHVEPQLVQDNPSCSDFGYASELKVEPVDDGVKSDGTLTVNLDVNEKKQTFSWTSDIPIGAVIVKGGPDANLYDYGSGSQGDTNLKAPGTAGLSHVSFCYPPKDTPPPPPDCKNDPTHPDCQTTEPPPPPDCEADPTHPDCPTTEPPPPPVDCDDPKNADHPDCVEPPADFCTGHAYDLRVDAAGIVSGFVGPAIATDPDEFPDRETFSSLALTFPGASKPIATAVTLDAENSGDPETGCTTRITYEDLVLDLNNLSDTGGIPVKLTAEALKTIATSKLNPDGTVTTSTHVTIVGGSLTITGDPGAPRTLALEPDPNSEVINECFADPGGQGSLCVAVVLHEQNPIAGGIEANAIRIMADLQTPIPGVNQSVDVKVAHAEADAHPGA